MLKIRENLRRASLNTTFTGSDKKKKECTPTALQTFIFFWALFFTLYLAWKIGQAWAFRDSVKFKI